MFMCITQKRTTEDKQMRQKKEKVKYTIIVQVHVKGQVIGSFIFRYRLVVDSLQAKKIL